MDNQPDTPNLREDTRRLAAAIGRFAKSLRLYLTSQDTLDQRLAAAVEAGDIARIQKAAAEGGNVNRLSSWREDSVLLKAIEGGKPDVVAALLALGAKPNLKVGYGDTTAMAVAAKKGHAQIMAMMLDAGGDVNAKTSVGMSLFTFAVATKNDAMADLLLARGANPDTARHGAWSALAYAARNNDEKRVRQLLDLDVRTYVRNDDGHTALTVAQASENFGVASLIQAHIDAKVPAWQAVDADQVAHVGIFRGQGYRLTEIFNFKTEEATLVTHNFETGKDSTMVRSFAAVASKSLIEEARSHLPKTKTATLAAGK